MHRQAKKWKDLALGYVSDVISLVQSFVVKLLEYLLPEHPRIRDGLHSLLIDDLRGRYKDTLNHAKFLLDVELGGIPATYNHHFNETLEKCRMTRSQKRLAKGAYKEDPNRNMILLKNIVSSHPLSNVDHMIREIHDILQSYYEVALKRFVDNVRMQVIDYFLIIGPNTPLKLLSPKLIAQMTSTQLDEVAGEEPTVRRRRSELEKEIGLLDQGLRILR